MIVWQGCDSVVESHSQRELLVAAAAISESQHEPVKPAGAQSHAANSGERTDNDVNGGRWDRAWGVGIVGSESPLSGSAMIVDCSVF